MKKKIRLGLNIGLAILSVVLLGFGIFNLVTINSKGGSGGPAEVDSLSNAYFVVGKDPTEYQKENFKLLTKELENEPRDDAKVAEYVTKAFIIDFYTWSNKNGAWDVGGTQYVYNYGMFFSQAVGFYYKDIDMFIAKYGQENLPTVSNITIDGCKTIENIEVDGATYPAYACLANWEYEVKEGFDASKFQTFAEFYVLKQPDGLMLIYGWLYE
ncbi:MAG: hypothetical protein LBR25_07265 [Erysipelotrichaceae bacterium]|jgi:hypothetical protein|nr:hypothetical protein [Erysipelotrichaceae bacterium]